MRRHLHDNWIGLVVLLAVVVGLIFTLQRNAENNANQRRDATLRREFNARTCQKGAELRYQGNRAAVVVNALKAATTTITKAAAEASGDPPQVRARYGAIADQIDALPEVPVLPPTDCPAVVKLYSPTP